jgi:hypothetical protein
LVGAPRSPPPPAAAAGPPPTSGQPQPPPPAAPWVVAAAAAAASSRLFPAALAGHHVTQLAPPIGGAGLEAFGAQHPLFIGGSPFHGGVAQHCVPPLHFQPPPPHSHTHPSFHTASTFADRYIQMMQAAHAARPQLPPRTFSPSPGSSPPSRPEMASTTKESGRHRRRHHRQVTPQSSVKRECSGVSQDMKDDGCSGRVLDLHCGRRRSTTDHDIDGTSGGGSSAEGRSPGQLTMSGGRRRRWDSCSSTTSSKDSSPDVKG